MRATAVHFREDPVSPSLWVVSLEHVCSFFIKQPKMPMMVLDERQGAEMRCAVVNDERQLVVTHTDVRSCAYQHVHINTNRGLLNIYGWHDGCGVR